MRVVFLGTPLFAAEVLRILAASRHGAAAVFTQPDRPRGRSRRPQPSPVKTLAAELGIDVFQPENVNTPEAVAEITALRPDVLAVAAFGQIFRKPFLKATPEYFLNVHASLLPRHRGPNPIAWAIKEGDEAAGVSIMAVTREVDAGAVYLRRDLPVSPGDTTGTLSEKLAPLGGEALLEVLDAVEAGTARADEQDHPRATYAPMFKKSDGLIDWNAPAAGLERYVRAMRPWPGAFTFLERTALRMAVLEAGIKDAKGEPGAVLDAGDRGILVAAGQGALLVTRFQAAGRKVCDAAAFLRGTPIEKGDRFGGARV